MADDFDKSDWHEWCQHPVTLEMFAYVHDKINAETWALIENAGESVHQSARASGKILAFGDVLSWKPEKMMTEVDRVYVVPEEDDKDES